MIEDFCLKVGFDGEYKARKNFVSEIRKNDIQRRRKVIKGVRLGASSS